MSKKWCVVTPDYDQVMPILDDGSGPTETLCDVVEVEAKTAREAVRLAVKGMLAGTLENEWCGRFVYVHEQRADCKSPYTGVKAEPYLCAEDCQIWDNDGTARCSVCGWTLSEAEKYCPELREPMDVVDINGTPLRKLLEATK